MTERSYDVCPKYWWRNILYIQNFFGRETMVRIFSYPQKKKKEIIKPNVIVVFATMPTISIVYYYIDITLFTVYVLELVFGERHAIFRDKYIPVVFIIHVNPLI